MDEKVCFVYDLGLEMLIKNGGKNYTKSKKKKNYTKSKKKKKGLFGEALFLTTTHLVVLLIL